MTEFHSVLDNAITTLDGGIDDDDLVINVIDGSKFPLTVDCPLILTIEANTANMEKVLITANAANVLTVDASGRGYEGSVAKSHASGVKIELLYVATNITELQGAVNALENQKLNDITAPDGDVSMNTHKLTDVVDPAADQDAATKKYVDDTVQGSFSPSITVENPSDSDDILIFFTNAAITITEMRSTTVGGTSVLWSLYHYATDRANAVASGNEVCTAGTTTSTADTNGIDQPTDDAFNDATIPADSWVVLSIETVTGVVTEFGLTIFYTKD